MNMNFVIHPFNLRTHHPLQYYTPYLRSPNRLILQLERLFSLQEGSFKFKLYLQEFRSHLLHLKIR